MNLHVIVLPGGGYEFLSDDEAEPIAEWLQQGGYRASVFRYPVDTFYPAVLTAILNEVDRVKVNGADKVVLLGFSAGGHAAGLAALSSDSVAGVILCYPVVSMELDTHAGSRIHLLGLDATPELRAATSLNKLVNPSSPPMFIWHTADDGVVSVEHAYLLVTALANAAVSHELHVYPRGVHGLNLAKGAGAPGGWTTLCLDWLANTFSEVKTGLTIN